MSEQHGKINWKQLLAVFLYVISLVACSNSADHTFVTVTQLADTAIPSSVLSPAGVMSATITKTPSLTPKSTATPVPTKTLLPSSTPSAVYMPDYSNIPPLVQLMVTKRDVCLANSLPIISQYDDVHEIDLTSSTAPEYCAIDCARLRWVASDGAKITFTVVQASSPAAARTLLKKEFNRVEQLYSDRNKYLGVSYDDPYTGEGDTSWAGIAAPGFIGHYATIRSSLFIVVEWYIVPKGFDLEFDVYMTENLVRLQFQKIDGALGTPFPSLTQQARCAP